MNHARNLSTRSLARAAVLAAAVVVNGLLLFAVPNVELVTATVAMAGLLLGPRYGALVGVVGMGLFGAINPIGSSLAMPPLWIAQMLGQGLNGLIFGMVRGRLRQLKGLPRIVVFAAFGLLVTMIYQAFMSLSFWLFAPGGRETFIGVLIGGLVFSLMQLISNTLIFAIVVPAAELHLRRLPALSD